MENRKYKAVIFDLDGTLLDTLDDLWSSVNHTMKVFGYPERTRNEVRAFVGNGVDRLIELCLPGGADDINRNAAISEYRRYYNENSEVYTKPYDGIVELIAKLTEAGIKVSVVSNKIHLSTVTLCKKYFSAIEIVCGEREAEGIRRKPHPDTVLQVAKELGVDISECVYVGDSEVDVETAKNACMDCIAVLWGFRDRDYLESRGAQIFASDTKELYDRIIR